MATLFFDGFDRGTVLKKLDPNFWSTEYNKYPKYAFGGYTYNQATISGPNSVYYDTGQGISNIVYTYSSINNGTEPRYGFTIDQSYGWYGSSNAAAHVGNYYPGFGQNPGFLALTNIPINNNSNLEPISYIKLSGFPSISGSKSYFGVRCLGIETKHQDYHNDIYPLGRFGYKHPFIAFCSGNTTGLILNFVYITGEHLLPLVTDDSANNNIGPKYSIGLEVEQNGGVSGIFDLNISDTISNYRITPLYCGGTFPYTAATSSAKIPVNSNYKILTIANTRSSSAYSAVISRWTHFEFEMDHSTGRLRTKIEGVDALVENKDTDIDRENWDIEIYISGFKYDNIRFFNRTYHTGMYQCDGSYEPGFGGFSNSYLPWKYGCYYYLGALTLLDDITLVDNTGIAPTNYVGYDAKVLPLNPGAGPTSLGTNATISDGLLQWQTNASSARRALASLDKDVSTIYASESGLINAIRYSNINTSVNADPNSSWRVSFNDGIGGVKVYNNARKNFLDSSFINVIRSGIQDPLQSNVSLMLEPNANTDSINVYYPQSRGLASVYGNSSTVITPTNFRNSSIEFDNSYIYLNHTTQIAANPFTIEAWVYLSNSGNLTLYSYYPINYPASNTITPTPISNPQIKFYSFAINTSGINFDISNFTYGNISRKLFFPQILQTGVWNHVAITRDSSNVITWFLNGQSGTNYRVISTDIASWNSPYYEAIGSYTQSLSINFSLEADIFNNGTPYGSFTPYLNIGGESGYINEYRVTIGANRYNENFVPASFPYPAEDYVEFGPIHESTRSLYTTYQFYQMTNPATNQPWTSGQVISSGLVLGVKKL